MKSFVLIFFAWSAIAGAALLLPPSMVAKYWRVFVAWGAVAPVYYLSFGDTGIIFAAAAIIVVALTPATLAQKVAFYIAVVPFLPYTLQFFVPFPGINFLAMLTPQRLCIFLLLIPILFSEQRSKSDQVLPAVLVSLFVVYVTIVAAPVISATAAVRFFIDQYLVYVIPIIAIPMAIRSERDLEDCLSAFVVVSAILASIAAVSALLQWNIYTPYEFADFRAGRLRITGTANTHSLAYHCAVALLFLEAIKRSVRFSWPSIMLLRVVLLAAMSQTMSRGAFAGLATGAVIMFVFWPMSVRMRQILLAGCAAGGVVAGYWLVKGDVAQYDPHGTFAYRQELFNTSIQYIKEHLIFGDPDYLRSGRFDHLIQGEGIIDITNYYLQIALSYGLIGIALVFGGFATVVYRLAFPLLTKKKTSAEAKGPFLVRTAILGAFMGWLVLVTTTSDVGLTLHLGVLLTALGHAANILAKPSRVAIGRTSPPFRVFLNPARFLVGGAAGGLRPKRTV